MRRDVQSQWMQSGTKSYWTHFCALSCILVSKTCRGSNNMEQLLTQHKFPRRVLRAMFPGRIISRSGVISWPVCSLDLAVSDYFLWGYVRVRVYVTRPANIAALNSEFWSVFKGSPRKCYNVLWQPFHRDCRSVLNGMVAIYKVSYSNNNGRDEFSRTWNAPDSVNTIFQLCLKKLFHLKQTPSNVFWRTL